MSGFSSFRKYLTRADWLLLFAGVLGGIFFLLIIPHQHPDSLAEYVLSEDDVETRASEFLAASGFSIQGLLPEVSLRRNTDVLMEAQRTLGRARLIGMVAESEEGEQVLPTHYWRVQYRVENEEESNSISVSMESGQRREHGAIIYTVLLSTQGVVWDVNISEGRRQEGPRDQLLHQVDRGALAHVFATPTTDDGLTQERSLSLSQIPDSVFSATYYFDREDTLWQAQKGQPVLSEGELLDTFTMMQEEMRKAVGLTSDTLILSNRISHDGDTRSFTVSLPQGTASAYAYYHLDRSMWRGESFQIEDVRVVPRSEGRIAEVRLTRSEPLFGQPLELRANVTAGGTLLGIDSTFPSQERPRDVMRVVADVAEGLFYLIMFLVLVIAFFRRMNARLVDSSSTRVDGFIVGFLVALLILLMDDVQFSSDEMPWWAQWGIKSVVASLAGTLAGLFTGFVSGAADSLTRSIWDKKLFSTSLLRQGAFRNIFVGGALLRGVGLAGVLLGIVALVLLLPNASLIFENRAMLPDIGYQPMVLRSVWAALTAYFVCLFALLGIGTFVRTFTNKLGVFVPLVVLAVVLGQGGGIEFLPAVYSWLLAGLVGLVLALSYWRFDFLSCVTGLFLALAFWGVNAGWVAPGSPSWVDVMLVGILASGVFVLGLVGLTSGRTQREVGEYVPAYVEELTRQERMKRELEIAHQVQESFLPKRMPQVEGLDIAAMCLAALDVGGDYYDFIELEPGRLAVVVGDVSGKGIQAAFFMTLTKGILQTLCREEPSPAEVLRRLNTLFCENAPKGTFISMIYGVVDVEARTFTFARAGHNPVILKRSPSQESDMMQPAGLAIGLSSGPLFDNSIEEATIDLRMGDVLVFYTDGFSEAMNRAKELYTDERLAQRVSMFGQRTAAEILRSVSEDVHHFMEGMGRHDDMTMVVVKLSRRQVYRPSHTPSEAHQSTHG